VSSEVMIAGMLHYWRRSSRPWKLQNVVPHISGVNLRHIPPFPLVIRIHAGEFD